MSELDMLTCALAEHTLAANAITEQGSRRQKKALFANEASIF
jgi:hypothetical protein